MSSLVDNDAPKKDKFANITWKRASEIYKAPKIFDEKISPDDINQGGLGNCYYLCTLSAMAEVPERIKEMFVTKEINKAGIYLMTFWINGVETPVIVDDHIPCRNNNPCFSSTDTQEIWAMLLEKAWAKLYGAYARTEGGQPSFASVHLQGVPSWSLTHADLKTTDEKEKFWYMIKSMDSRQFTMMASSLG